MASIYIKLFGRGIGIEPVVIISNMTLRGINHSNLPVKYYRYGNLKGCLKEGELQTGDTAECLSDQEVWFEQEGVTVIAHGYTFGGSVNDQEVHERLQPVQVGGILGLLFIADIRGSYIDEPIIGKSE